MDARPVTPADLDRFRKMLGMLGSDQSGERSAAALKCSAWLREHSLTWADVSLPVVVDAGVQRRVSDDLERAVRRANPSRADRAAKRAMWEGQRYGADADGFEPGPRK